MQSLILAVVEAEAVPCRMLAAASRIEVEVAVAVETSETLHLVFHSMRVDYVHYYGYAERVGLVDKALEVVGGAEAR